jgi:hypothetical protein
LFHLASEIIYRNNTGGAITDVLFFIHATTRPRAIELDYTQLDKNNKEKKKRRYDHQPKKVARLRFINNE